MLNDKAHTEAVVDADAVTDKGRGADADKGRGVDVDKDEGRGVDKDEDEDGCGCGSRVWMQSLIAGCNSEKAE